MGLLERIDQARRPSSSREAARATPLAFQEWVDLFQFGGISYPLLQTTQGKLDEEQIAQTATAAYKSNGIVFALILARLQVFSQARFQWTRFEGGQPSRLFGTEDLRVLERPWRGGTTGDLLARMEVDVSLAGNAYIRRVGNTLHRLRPDWVIIVLGSNEDTDRPAEAGDVEVIGYIYDPPSARTIALEPFEVAHYAPIPDPDSNFLGMSWITPVLRDMQADSAQTEHKRAFLTNAATPNMAVKFDTSVTLEQAKKFKELFLEEHSGWQNAWKTMFLLGGADLQVVGKDFQELDFAATQGRGESRLASAAGVPPSWVGFAEGLAGSALNAGNFTAARRRFSDGTMMHLWSNAASSLEVIVRPTGNARGASLWFDLRSVAFMREDAKDAAQIQATEAQTITALVREGFTHESSIDAVANRDWTRLEPRTDEDGTPLISVQLNPARAALNDADGDEGGDNERDPGGFESARGLTELVQKIYLGTQDKVVLSQREAREILNRAGADLPLDSEPILPSKAPTGVSDTVSSNGDGS